MGGLGVFGGVNYSFQVLGNVHTFGEVTHLGRDSDQQPPQRPEVLHVKL